MAQLPTGAYIRPDDLNSLPAETRRRLVDQAQEKSRERTG